MYDIDIREPLRQFLLNRNSAGVQLIEELPVCNGSAIADIVTLGESAHCYEIKGSRDKIWRAVDQGDYYNLSFSKITLVADEKHIDKSFELLPEFWGIISAKKVGDNVSFRYERGASRNSNQRKSTTLQMLWRDELVELASLYNVPIIPKKSNRIRISEIIEARVSLLEINREVSKTLSKRLNNVLEYERNMGVDHCF